MAEPLPPHLEPLLSHNMDILVHQFHLPGNYCIVGTEKEHGISYILSALLHKYEHAKVHNCAYSRLLTDNLARTPEESLARRFLGGGIVVIPHFREMWEGGKDLLCRLVDEDGKSKRTSLVCTANSIEDLDVADRIVMEEQFGFKTFLRLREPSEDSKVRFVRSLEKELDIKWKKQAQVKEHAPLQIDDPVPIPVQRAPKPPPSAATLKKEEHYLRELRVALRACMNEIFKERKYKPFAAPVDPEEVPDYYDIIKKPMCLEDICENIDGGAYLCVEDFKADVDLIVANVKEYNPRDRSDHRGKNLAHVAAGMRDAIESTLYRIERHLKYSLYKRCRKIKMRRDEAAETATDDAGSCSKNRCRGKEAPLPVMDIAALERKLREERRKRRGSISDEQENDGEDAADACFSFSENDLAAIVKLNIVELLELRSALMSCPKRDQAGVVVQSHIN